MSSLPIIPTPPAIIRQAKKEYSQLVAEISQLQQVDDETALEMGDRLLEVESLYGKVALKKAAGDAGVTWSVARQRHWVARKIPRDSKLRNYLKTTHLTFSHLRAIASTAEPEKWADAAVKGGLSVAALVEKIEQKDAKTAQEEGELCIECEKSLTDSNEMVSFTIMGRGKARCCSVVCAAAYFIELSDSTQDGDPFVTTEEA